MKRRNSRHDANLTLKISPAEVSALDENLVGQALMVLCLLSAKGSL